MWPDLAADDVDGPRRASASLAPGVGQQVGGAADRRQRVAQLVRERRQEFVLLLVGFAQRLLRAVLLGDVVALDEDALHPARGVAQRLVHEVHDKPRAPGCPGPWLIVTGNERPTKGMPVSYTLSSQSREALFHHLGQRLGHRLAHQLAVAVMAW